MKTHGEFPDILFRSFDRIEYAQQFLSGFIRFGSVVGYGKIEDKRRRDETEGLGHYLLDGRDVKIQFCSNVVYALCCHLDIKSAIETNHGKYVVEVANPLYLAEEITRAIGLLNSKHFGGTEGVFIEYTKGNEKSEKLD